MDFLDRFEAASSAGFTGVEFLFPYKYTIEDLKSRLQRYGLLQVLHNMPPGDWEAGERGLASLPDRVQEFRESVDVAIEYASALECPQVHCMLGIKPEGVSEQQLLETLLPNLAFAADKLKSVGVKLLIEAINTTDMPGYYLNTSKQAMSIIEQVESDNVFFQYDIYHMQMMEGRLAATIERLLPNIPHMQLADTPGRHEPGTGEINYPWLFGHLDRIGYEGWIGCEYFPQGNTAAGLGWFKAATRDCP